MRKLLFPVLVIGSLTGCATTGQNAAGLKQEFQAGIQQCDGKEACDAAWEAAQVWVAQNSRLKIQTATNVLIETYGGGQYDPTLSMRVLKEPSGNGKYRIVFSGGCNNMFGCQPNVFEAGVRFNQVIKASLDETSQPKL
jgi:hypothetical protein